MANHYTHIANLSGIYLEDSFVLAIAERPGQLSFEFDAVLTREHFLYRESLAGEQHCYALGALVFDGVTQIEWIQEGAESIYRRGR
jgi:hypothetical protein